jgi:hypothetical protein
METARPVTRPLINRPAPVPTLVRVPQDSGLFRGWGVTL